MSSGTKKTIIGVVVGIGGAILLAALGIVLWRIFGRRRAAEDTDDGLMGSPVGMEKEKQSGTSKFTNPLEAHHAATNF